MRSLRYFCLFFYLGLIFTNCVIAMEAASAVAQDDDPANLDSIALLFQSALQSAMQDPEYLQVQIRQLSVVDLVCLAEFLYNGWEAFSAQVAPCAQCFKRHIDLYLEPFKGLRQLVMQELLRRSKHACEPAKELLARALRTLLIPYGGSFFDDGLPSDPPFETTPDKLWLLKWSGVSLPEFTGFTCPS